MEALKELLKAATNGSFRLAVEPLVRAFRLEEALVGSSRRDDVFEAYSQLVSLFPGLSGQYLRRAFYEATLPRCGHDFTVGFGTVFSKRGVFVGERVYVGLRCTIGNVELGDNVTIGSNVDILSGSRQHNFDDLEKPIQDQGGTFETVHIGENSWLGNGTTVMADIGKFSIIGAGSVVTKALPDRVIAVGNPARVIRQREIRA